MNKDVTPISGACQINFVYDFRTIKELEKNAEKKVALACLYKLGCYCNLPIELIIFTCRTVFRLRIIKSVFALPSRVF